MKKISGICIDLRNKEQVKWWNKVGSKLVRVVRYTPIVETATNKEVAYIFDIRGLFKEFVIKKNLEFINNPKTVIINVKK